MKKYMKYLALCAVVAMGGYVTKADAGFMDDIKAKAKGAMNAAKNAADPCNAGAGGSPKGPKVADKCLADDETAAKHPNFCKAYLGAHCAGGNDLETDTHCTAALAGSGFPEGFKCDADAAASEDPAVVKLVTGFCLKEPGVLKAASGDKANDGVVGFYKAWYPTKCGDTPDKKFAKQCKAVLKAIPDVAG